MRLNQILPLPITPLSSAKKDERAKPKPKPPDVDAGLTGEQVHAVARQEDRRLDDPWSDETPPGHIDITV
jgi:hypothetical protein